MAVVASNKTKGCKWRLSTHVLSGSRCTSPEPASAGEATVLRHPLSWLESVTG
ncbi:hypothetical protein HDA41_007227 [Streptomyces caelestis]|uniref:Uncharacterized protein n=1 Tax=Streptomyces caelestis TaxID=36816 RepID=A0A7W9HBQ3_9ACTN|nr:hypothetical protein [Streptomyces caelestis]